MDIRQLNYFVQVADCGSYSLASQKLFISQPALSKAIKNIEDEMGFTFFYTCQRKQKLTDAGQAFYEKAVKLLESYDELIKVTYLEEQIDKGHLNIGLSMAAGPALFTHIFPKFRKMYPQITFSVTEKETSILKDAILRKEIDLAYIDLNHIKEPEDTDNFDVYDLICSEMVVVVSSDNPMASKEQMRYEELDGKPVILFDGGKESSSQVENDMRNLGVKPEVVLSSTQWNFIMDMVASDMGVVLCPYYIYTKFANPKITCIRLNEEMGVRHIGMIVKKGDYRTRACMNFLKFATDANAYDEVLHLFNHESSI